MVYIEDSITGGRFESTSPDSPEPAASALSGIYTTSAFALSA